VPCHPNNVISVRTQDFCVGSPKVMFREIYSLKTLVVCRSLFTVIELTKQQKKHIIYLLWTMIFFQNLLGIDYSTMVDDETLFYLNLFFLYSIGNCFFNV
jgi:hypothetical protein